MLNFPFAAPQAPNPSVPPRQDAAPFAWLPAGVAFLRRRLVLIAGCAAVGVVLGAGYLATTTPQYTAVATLTIDTRRAHPVGGQQSSGDWQSESAYVESQVELIRSPATLRGVVERLQLDSDPSFRPTPPGAIRAMVTAAKRWLTGAGDAAIDPTLRGQALAGTALARMLEVWRIGTTSVVEVRVRTADRALSARLANAVTEAYMAQQLVAISETTRRAGGWLETRIVELRGQAVAADRAVQEYKARNNIVDVGTGAGIGLLNEQQVGELNVQVAAARARLAEAEARFQRAQANTVNGVTEGVVSDLGQNPVMAGLRQQFLDGSRRLVELTARQGPNHGAVVLQRNAVAELQRSIQNELARLTETYRGDYEVAQANLRAIQDRLAEQIAIAAQTNIERSELRSLQSSADAYRQIYETFLQRFTQAMQDQSYPISDARVAAVALAPIDPSHPRAAIVLAVALALGLALGMTTAVAREALDGTVRTVAQLRRATGLQCLGAVPRQGALGFAKGWRWRQARRARAARGQRLVPAAFLRALRDPDSGIAEAVHGVRVAAARQSARGRDVRVIGCVAAVGDEGTSTFAANLAFALAADGQRSVLVDWNAAAPWLTKMLGPHQRIGLQDLAFGEASLTEASWLDSDTGLRFIGQSHVCGHGRPPPSTASARAVLARLREGHDIVVLDLPPLLAGNTAVRLSDIVDGFVLVTRWGSTSQPILSEALSRTAAADALFLGAVLNRCDPARMRLYPDEAAGPLQVGLPVPAAAG
ncbi:Wzz/FepE/Etk N-terminal domain-containing protein [Roseomonas sp. HF4]|uniref:Wzz/FepE/Etk N-terminal domain-containing protein n=1 Tax=Roseomonas sp. HF4 TaxID=2562313 RepID=UPI0010BF7BC5|nr:Wzz/FepE/Etk N-terminal domain-containing protein [Roseomonas sp. HF4]